MNIAIDSRSANLHSGSGIGTYTKNLVMNLINSIDDNLTLIWTGDYKYLLPKKDTTKIFLTSGKNNGFFETKYVPNLLLRDNIDLYHIPQNGLGFPFEYNLNTIVTIHDLIPYLMPETVGKGYLERFLRDMPNIIANSKGIFTVSEYSKKDILRFFPSFPEEKIIVTPLAANENFKPLNKKSCKKIIAEKYNINSPFLLYLGGFSSRKNVLNLIKAYEDIISELNFEIKLVLGGSLRDEGIKLKEYVTSKHLEEYILFPGFISDDILPIIYNACEIFIYPSLYEGFGLPILEAMGCMCPVITSNLSSIPEVAQDNALLINPYNNNEISHSILKILNNPSLKEDLINKGYKRSLEFSWSKTARITLEGYKKVAAQPL